MRKTKSSNMYMSLLCVPFIVGSLLAGCTKSTDSSTTSTAPAETAKAAAQVATDAPPAADAPSVLGIKLNDLNGGGTLKGQFKGTTIVIGTHDGDFADTLKDQAVYFEKVTGAKVEVQGFPEETFKEKVQLDLSTGHHFDGVVMPVAFLHGYAEGGLIQDLNPFVSKIGSPNLDMNDYIPSLLDIYGKYKGKLIALPYKPDAQMFMYRKDLFEDPKIMESFKQKTGSDLKVPTTPEEFAKTAAFFTKSLNPDSPVKYGYSTMASKGNSRFIWDNRLAAYGGKDVDADFKPAFNNEAGLKAMKFTIELQKYAPKELLTMDWDTANNFFAAGDVAMMEQWPGGYTTSQGDSSKIKGKVGVAVTPGGAPTLGGWAASVTSTTKNADATYKFIEFVTSKDGELLKLLNKAKLEPTRVSNYKRPEIAASNPLYPNFLASLSVAKVLADPDVPYISSKLNDIEEYGVQAAMRGELTPEQALKYMDDNFVKEIKDAGLSK
jgi:multiple sugar transport system substrate-binding protein